MLCAQGYGRISIKSKPYKTHRVLFEIKNGRLPSTTPLDHLCRNTRCVNPKHLEPVTDRENIMRGTAPTAINAAKTHCNNGHELPVANGFCKGNPKRVCRKCEKEYNKILWEKHRKEHPSRGNKDKTHCPLGHEYSAENTSTEKNGARVCKKCNRIKCEKYRNKKRLSHCDEIAARILKENE